MKELYLLMEEEELNAQHSDNKTCAGDSWTQNTVRSQPSPSPVLPVFPLFSDRFLPPSLTCTGAAEGHCLVTGPRYLVLWGSEVIQGQ